MDSQGLTADGGVAVKAWRRQGVCKDCQKVWKDFAKMLLAHSVYFSLLFLLWSL